MHPPQMPTSGLGQCIEDYEVLDLLGKGGFASVYRAKCRRTFMEVAIKMIDKNLMFQRKMQNRVVEEVKIHSQLKHPSVLQLYTRFEDKNYVYLVLELAHNGELHRYMKANKIVFTEEQARQILKQVVDGLRYLHSHNIIHRDMTLSNLLLTKDHRVKIADFGLATKLAYPGETHKTMCGTPNYISPEIALRRTHGLETDVWGLGCVLFTLLVGRPPFDTRAIQCTLERVINLDYHIPDYLSNEARDLISRLLQEKPEDRIHLDQIPNHPFMNETPSLPYYKQQSGHLVESGLGTTLATTGCRQDTFSPHHSKQASIRSRSLDRRDSSKAINGLRQKFQNILPLQGMSPMSPNFLPSRQHHFHLADMDRLETSTHSKKDRSMQEPVRSGCSRHESNCSQRSKQSCDRVGTHGGSVRSSFDEEKCESVKCSSHRCGKNSDSCCGSNHSRGHYQDGVDLDLNNVQCRTCGLASEGLYSQCLQCRRIDHVDEGCRNRECDCSRRSKCHCENERECLPTSERDREKDGAILNSVMNSERKFLPDLRVALPEHSGKSRGTSRSKSSERLQLHYVEEDDAAVNEFVGIKIDKNQKRNLDHVPLNVPPLCSNRLKPARYKTNNFVISILETGEVCLEKLKKRKNGKKEKVIEVCRVSSDGLRVLVYSPESGRGITVGDEPPPVPHAGADAMYSYHSLPPHFHRPYETAARFVRLHQAQTPKVTLHSSLASCFLMENSPTNDFHVKFYSGFKLLKTEANNGAIKLIDPDGKTQDLEESTVGHLSSAHQKMWDHFRQMHDHCLLIERVLEQVSTNGSPCFPVTIGSKPSVSGIFKGKENTTPSQHLPLLGSCEVSETTVTSRTSHLNSRSQSRAVDIKSASQVVLSGLSDISNNSRQKLGSKDCTLDLPHLRAVATKKSGGELKIMYRDGTELTYNEPAGTVEYQDGARTARYRTSDTDTLPVTVRRKLAQVPDILWHFLPADVRHRPRAIR